ncbi:Bulb-type lectin domain-containing protein [Artemisia annua]|uniref:Bulb-type lectin domain-containing protein n=1 Tax=Artemisia annua TaxID=35608 RepID=A0A2U1MFN2_ARTAN|nr:Bulb-type lectin domain-containing protein [Artemisia annua]
MCGITGSGACGLNNVCSLNSARPTCECPHGFSLFDSNDPRGDRKPDFSPSCDEAYSEDQYDFIELNDIDWPLNDYAHMNPSNGEDCKTSCLKDCFFAVAIYMSDQYWKKRLPLSNGKTDFTPNVKAFLKYRKGDRPPQNPPVFLQENKNQRSLIVVGSALLGISIFVIIVLVINLQTEPLLIDLEAPATAEKLQQTEPPAQREPPVETNLSPQTEPPVVDREPLEQHYDLPPCGKP